MQGRVLRLVLATLLTVTVIEGLGPAAAARGPTPDTFVLLAEPGAPPGQLSEESRIPPLADLDEDGLRDPAEAPIDLPAVVPVPELGQADLVRLPTASGPNFDAYGDADSGAAHVAAVFPDPVNQQGPDGGWHPVRGQLVRDPGYGWKQTLAGVTLRFPNSLSAASPITFEVPGPRYIAVSLTGVDEVPGKLDEEGVIHYADALPSMDLAYWTGPRGYEELATLRSAEAPAEWSYRVEAVGLTLSASDTGEILILGQEGVLAVIPQPVAWDSATEPTYSPGTLGLVEVSAGLYEITVGLDRGFLAQATYPVLVDPGSALIYADTSDTYVDAGAPSSSFTTDYLRVAASPARYAFVRFDVSGLRRDDRIVYEAQLNMYAYDAISPAPVEARRVLDPWPSPMTWNNQPSAGQVLATSTPSPLGDWDLEEMYQHVLQSDIADPWPDYGVRLSTSGSASYRFGSANQGAVVPWLQLSYNDLPHAPQLDGPTDGFVSEDDTPTLRVQGGQDWPSDPNGDDVLVQFQISDSPSDFTNPYWESPWLDSRSYVMPSGILVDGQTYYWRARSWDTCSPSSSDWWQPCSLTDALGVQHEQETSGVRSFTVVLKHFGDDERWAMWSHDAGSGMTLNVNEANGNLFVDVPLDSLATPVGDLAIGLTYNSQLETDFGLSRGWDLAIGPASSGRELPIELVKLADFPGNGLKIRFRGGRTAYFPHRDHHVFATVTAGAGTVKQNADGTFIYTTPQGDTYEFTASGKLSRANPVAANLSSGANAFRYTIDAANQLEKVTDPLGRVVNLNWSAGKLQWIRTWAGQTWTFGYNAANDRLRTISVDVTSLGVTRPETVGFAYHTGTALPGGLLAEVDHGETYASGATGWRVEYAADTAGNWRVSRLTPPPGGGPTPLASWQFQYLGEIKGSTAAQACVTDPLGVPDATAPIECNLAHQTIVDFNWAGLPIRIAGPADQTGYWPVTTTIWDSNNNLLCERSPAANAVQEITGANNCTSSKHSTVYTYESEAPFRLLSVTHPSPSTDGTAARVVDTYQYDSDTNGARYNGLWVEKYENPTLSGIPADESVWQSFDVSWGTGSPPGIAATDGFSMRWSGLIDTTGWGVDTNKVRFRVTTYDEGVSLVVDNKVLLDCLGTVQPTGTYNCGTSQPVVKWMNKGLHPITIEYSDISGPASFKLQWSVSPTSYEMPYEVIPTSKLQTNLGLLTVVGSKREGFSTPYLKTAYHFPDDNAMARHIPDSIAVTDTATGEVRKTAYTYNSYGQVRSVTTAAATTLAATTTTTYTNNATISCVDQVTDPTGAVTTYTCNPAGDITRVDQAIRATASQPAQTRTTTTDYDSLGRVVRVTLPSGGSTTTSYDRAGRVSAVDRYLGTGAGHDAHAITTYAYDDAGHLLTEQLPPIPNPANPAQTITPVITHRWDWLDDEVSTVDARGKTWTYLYDALRRVIQTTSPSGLVSTTEYRLRTAPSGGSYQHQVTVRTPPGNTSGVPTVTALDVLGRTSSEKVGTLAATAYTYDVQGNLTQVTDPAGIKTVYTYNSFGQVTQEAFGNSGIAYTDYTYDAAGRLRTLNGPRTDKDDSLTYGYDEAGRLTSVTQNGLILPGGSTPVITTYTWDDAGERVRISQPMTSSLTQVRDWTYDTSGNVASYADAKGTTTFGYGPAGWLEQVGDPRGITLRFEYDNLGRQTRRYRSAPSVADDQSFVYDQAGNLVQAKVAATGTTITAEYDNDARLWKVYQAASAATTTYTYSASTGLLSSITDPAGTTTFTYNANGLIGTITDPFSTTKVVYTYDTAGRVRTRTDAAKLCWSQTYETSTGRVDVRQIKGGRSCATTLASFDLGYDKAGNVASRAVTLTGNTFAGTYSYFYDEANRLTTVTGPSTSGRTYAYDGAGNRTSVRIGTGTPVTTTYDAAGLAVSSSDGTAYTHDATGNLTAIDKAGTTSDWYLTYSSWSQLTKAARTPTGSDVTYTLDALDRVLARTAGGTATSYTYQGMGEVLAKAQVGTSSPMTYANTPSGPLAQKVTSGKTTTVRYYLRDPHGDVVGVSDTSGALKGTALYDPWGQILSGTGELGTLPAQGGFRFQSDLMDASTGQLDMGARWYEPSLGRFSTPDPLMGQLTSPLSLNRYLYGLASPLTYTDPTGLSVRPTSGGGGHCGRGCQAQVQEMSQQTWDNAITAALAAAAAAIPDVPYLVITRKQMYGEPLLLHDYAGTSVLEALSRTMRGTGEILTAGGDFVAEVSSDVGLVVLVVCRGCEELAPLLGLISAGGKAVAAVGNALRGRWKEAVADTGFAALGLATGGVGPLYARLGELTGGLSKAEEVGIRVLQFVLETMQKAVELKVGYGFWQEGPST